MLYTLLGLLLLGAVTFVALGWWSRHGEHRVAGVAGEAATASAQADPGGRLAPCGAAPNCVCSDTDALHDPGHWVAALAWPEAVPSGDRQRVVNETVEALGGRVETTSPGYLHATFTSRVFGFVDDLELRLTADQLHVRSAARVGYSDWGVNRKRVESLRQRLLTSPSTPPG